MTLIDTHSHLLPGLDDGCRDFEETLSLALSAESEGVTDVVCTPHLDSTSDLALTKGLATCRDIQTRLLDAGVRITLHLGYELTFPFVQTVGFDALSAYGFGAKGRAVLLEAPYVGWPVFAEDFFFKVRLAGLTPLLAHPARNPTVQQRPELLGDLVRLGVVPQGTAPTLFGGFGSVARKTLLRQLAHGDIWIMASDAHFHRGDECSLARARAYVKTALPGVDTELLFEENPSRLLRGDPLIAPQPAELRRSLWGRLQSRWRATGERRAGRGSNERMGESGAL